MVENSIDDKGRVLVVEDEPANQALMLTVLKLLNYQATLAATGPDAIEKFSLYPYDIVLMDCHLPGLDGYQTTRRMRQLEATRQGHAPIIAVTACALLSDRKRCLEAGMNDYMAKPFCIDTLQSVLNKWLCP